MLFRLFKLRLTARASSLTGDSDLPKLDPTPQVLFYPNVKVILNLTPSPWLFNPRYYTIRAHLPKRTNTSVSASPPLLISPKHCGLPSWPTTAPSSQPHKPSEKAVLSFLHGCLVEAKVIWTSVGVILTFASLRISVSRCQKSFFDDLQAIDGRELILLMRERTSGAG